MPPLPSLSVVAPIYYTRHFLLSVLVAVLMTCGVNGIIDYFMQREKGPWYLIDKNTLPSVFIYAVIMAFLVFAGSGDVHKRIRNGQCEPVRCEALKNSIWKKFFLFPMGEPNWKCRLPLWVWWCAMVPAVITYIVLIAFCSISQGFSKLQTNDCPCTLAEYVVWTELWKGCICVALVAVNYAAAHNDEQREVQESLTSGEAQPEMSASKSDQSHHGLYTESQ
jgi:hypothetical protein